MHVIYRPRSLHAVIPCGILSAVAARIRFSDLGASMRCLVGAARVAGLCLIACLAIVDRAGAGIVVAIDKSKQRMTVVVDGIERHAWKVSTGLGGGPKSGTYRPERLERKWFSRKYNMSPMPNSIFFHEGYAIHGTIYVSRLGQPASHGCVRLHPADAATLFDLVRARGMSDTTIVVSNSAFAAKPVAKPKIAASNEPPAAPITLPAQEVAPTVTGAISPPPPKEMPQFQE